jgi:hypothetical protein
MTYGVRSLARHNPIEGLVAGGHLVEVKFHLAQCFCEDDIQAAAPINKGLRREGPVDYGVDDQQVGPGVRDVNPMIFLAERDWEFRPTLRPRVFGVDVPDLPGV